MSTGRQTVRDLVEEGKKRIVLLVILVVGLSYLMSLTSSSVWINLPAAASLIILLRYISMDLDMRRKAAAYNNKPVTTRHDPKESVEGSEVVAIETSSWRMKVNSPVVEAAIDQFTRHLVSEWVTDLWYSRLTPDRDGPEELVQLMNGVIGEVSCRVKDINLIDLLTRDIINLICTHLELYRMCVTKIDKLQSADLTFDRRDAELKLILAAKNKLHPALFSAEAEHRVLQHLMDGLISFTFKPADLRCSFFRLTVRELLACAVIRPVLNLASPRFINEKIESLVLSFARGAEKGNNSSAQGASKSKSNASRSSPDHFSEFLDHSVTGVELVQLKHSNSNNALSDSLENNTNGTLYHKDPLLSQSSHSWSSLPEPSQVVDGKDKQLHQSGGEWGKMLDAISHRKSQALAPEHFENMWTKGRDYRKKDGSNPSAKQDAHNVVAGSHVMDHSKVSSARGIKCESGNIDFSKGSALVHQYDDRSTKETFHVHTDQSSLLHHPVNSFQQKHEHDLMDLENVELESDDSSYTTEDEESTGVTGLDSPGTKVWDSKNNRNASLTYIRHPLESSESHKARKTDKGRAHCRRVPRTQLGRKRSRLGRERIPVWQEVERTSFLLGDGRDILNTSKGVAKTEESSDDPALEAWGRIHSGASASSSKPSVSVSEVHNVGCENSVLADSFLKLRCEVLGANIVRSGPRTFAVYSISVTDADSNVWSIKRRFRHFEELHRRLKEFREYNLSLPPKHFLSSGLEVPVVQERCELLDKYLKKLLELPTISGSIEVWDFLSVDSQTYTFSNSLSIVQTLSVDLDDKPHEKGAKVQDIDDGIKNPIKSWGEHLAPKIRDTTMQMESNFLENNSKFNSRKTVDLPGKNPGKECENSFEDLGSDSDGGMQKNVFSIKKAKRTPKERESGNSLETSESLLDAAADPTFPTEWVPPNLSSPILDLVDIIFQLHDGGWIRRQAFWVAKQVLQLGMGDAFDDWLIEKIQLLRRGSVIASAIKRVEQILWPDGIFITKRPKRQRPPQSTSQSQSSHYGGHSTPISSPNKDNVQKLNEKDNNLLTDEQLKEEAAQRAKFVYELMIDKAPAALVSLVGRKEYEKSAKDLYFFLQSNVCLKQLAFNLLELLLLSAFPELDDVVKQLDEEKQKFGQLEAK